MGADAVILHTKMDKMGGLLGVGARSVIEVTAMRGSREPVRVGDLPKQAIAVPTLSRQAAIERALRAAQQVREAAGVRKVAEEGSLTTAAHAARPRKAEMNYSEMLREAAAAIVKEQAARLGVELTMAVEAQRRRGGCDEREGDQVFRAAWQEVMARRDIEPTSTEARAEERCEDRSLTAVYGESDEARDMLIGRVITARARAGRGEALVLDCGRETAPCEVKTYAEALGGRWQRLREGQDLSEVIAGTSAAAAVIVRLGSATDIHRNPVRRLLALWEDARLGMRCVCATERAGAGGAETLGLRPMRTAQRVAIGVEERLGLEVVVSGTRMAWERMRAG